MAWKRKSDVDRFLRHSVLRRRRAVDRRIGVQDKAICAHAGAVEDSDHPGPGNGARRGPAHGARGFAVRKPVPRQ